MNIPGMAMAAVAALMAAAAMADSIRMGPRDELARHSATNFLWPSGRKVSDGACEFIGADCRTSFVQSAGSDDGSGADMDAVLAIAYENVIDDAGGLPAETGIGAISPNLDDGEGAEDGARQVSEFQGFDMAASAVGVGEANSWNLPMEGSVGEVAEIPVAGRSCSIPRAAGDAAFFEEIGGAVEEFADANLLPPDTSAGENSVGQLQVVAGACAMRIDP